MRNQYSGTFQPDHLVALKTAFDEVTAQPWFDQSGTTRDEFAKYLIATFPGEHFDMRRHQLLMEASARLLYARDVA